MKLNIYKSNARYYFNESIGKFNPFEKENVLLETTIPLSLVKNDIGKIYECVVAYDLNISHHLSLAQTLEMQLKKSSFAKDLLMYISNLKLFKQNTKDACKTISEIGALNISFKLELSKLLLLEVYA